MQDDLMHERVPLSQKLANVVAGAGRRLLSTQDLDAHSKNAATLSLSESIHFNREAVTVLTYAVRRLLNTL